MESKYFFMWRDEDKDKLYFEKRSDTDWHDTTSLGSFRISEHPEMLTADGSANYDKIDEWIKSVTNDPEALNYDIG